MPQFARYLGLDYSGAETAHSSLKGLRLYSATPGTAPTEVLPAPSAKKYWTRKGVAEWLANELRSGPPTLVGIDHGFSFPRRYFDAHKLPPDWPGFLDDFQRHWPTDADNTYVDFVRDGMRGQGALRAGNTRWRRLVEIRCRAKSVFHFDVQGSVAKSTHSGLPWLRYLRQQLGSRVHFWPFDGWVPPPNRSVIAEVYPALWNKQYPDEGRTSDQHDAYSVARWMQETDGAGILSAYFQPRLSPDEIEAAIFEGWILGLQEDPVAKLIPMPPAKPAKPRGLPPAQKARVLDFIAYQEGAVVSREIVKQAAGNVTLFAFDEGQGLSEHTVPFNALVRVLEGEVEILIAGQPHHLKGGEIILLPSGQPHAVRAVSRFKMLLTMIRG